MINGPIAPIAAPLKIFPTIFPIDSNTSPIPFDFVSCFTSTVSLVFVFICSSIMVSSAILFITLFTALVIILLSKKAFSEFPSVNSLPPFIVILPTSILL